MKTMSTGTKVELPQWIRDNRVNHRNKWVHLNYGYVCLSSKAYYTKGADMEIILAYGKGNNIIGVVAL